MILISETYESLVLRYSPGVFVSISKTKSGGYLVGDTYWY